MSKAKKQAAGKAKKKVPAKTAKAPVRIPPMMAVATTVDVAKASAIVGQVLTHFGAGYGAQHRTEAAAGATPQAQQIFAKPIDLAGFHFLLLDSVLRNFGKLNWDFDQPLRDTICKAAFEHGVLARRQVVADGDGSDRLLLVQILVTLKVIQKTICGATGAGGGIVCDF